MLDNIITSEARLKVLRYFFSNGYDFLPYVREIVRGTGLEINAVRRELQRLSSSKLLIEEKRGNRLHYKLNTSHSLYYDLASIIAREVGLGRLIYKKKKKIGNIKFCLLSLNYFLHREVKTPIDLIIVGDVYLNYLKELITEYQEKKGTEVNYMVLSEQEYRILRDRKDPLIMNAFIQPRSIIVGNQDRYFSAI